jgi:hypothetical protein
MTGTDFILNMFKIPDDQLSKADPAKLAAKHGMKPDWVAGVLRFWMLRA